MLLSAAEGFCLEKQVQMCAFVGVLRISGLAGATKGFFGWTQKN